MCKIENINENETILDIGCNHPELSATHRYLGFSNNPRTIRMTKNIYTHGSFMVADDLNLFKDKEFDVVITKTASEQAKRIGKKICIV